MKYYVIINGESSLDIEGLAIESLPAISKPLMRSKREEIDGRDGDIITQLGFSAYDKTLKIGLWGNYDIDEIISYFNQDGIISFSNEPDMYYNFTILNRIDFINQLEAFRKATITIHCQPFKYKEEETEELDIITKEVSGTDISVNDSYSGTMDIVLNGNTSQVQLSGKNLFNDYNTTSSTDRGITYSFTNNEILINGTFDKTGNWNCWLTASNDGNASNNMALLKANTTYTISIYIVSGTINNTNNQLFISSRNSNKTNFAWNYKIATYDSSTQRYKVSFTTTDSVYISGIRYSISPSNTAVFSNLKLKIQIEEGNTSTDFEQYCGGTPSPNPSYPQDINVVSGDNNVVVCGKNLFNKDTMVLNAAIDGGTGYMESSDNFRTIYFKCKPSTTYTIQKIVSNRFVIGYTNDNNVNLPKTLTNPISSSTSTTKYTFTTPSTANYCCIMVSKITDDTTNINDLLNSIQIEEGSTATTYEAYNGTTYPINLPVQGYNTPNLYDPTTAPVIDGCMAVKSAMKLHGVSLTKIKTTYMACNQNTKYLITKTLGGTNYFDVGTTTNTPAINGSLNQCEDAITETSYEITTGANDNYIVVSYWQDSETGDTKGSITIKEYSTKKEELSKIGTYQDYIYKENDKWYLHKEIGKVVLNGSETGLSYDFNCLRILNSTFKAFETTEIGEIYSNYYTKNKQVTLQNNAVDYGISYRGEPANGYVIRNKDITSLNDFKTWLSTHNTNVYYILATPTNTEITDTSLKEQLEAIKEAQSYLGTTNINQVNNDMPFILDVSYLSGTNSITITNHGNYYSKPKLTITGTGNIGIYLNDSQIFQVALGTNETIIIDTDKMEAYYESTLKNRQVIGDYNSFKLLSGENTIKISGTFSKLQVDNYSRWI